MVTGGGTQAKVPSPGDTPAGEDNWEDTTGDNDTLDNNPIAPMT